MSNLGNGAIKFAEREENNSKKQFLELNIEMKKYQRIDIFIHMMTIESSFF